MKETVYIMKVPTNELEALKKNKGLFSTNVRIVLWINYFIKENNLKDYTKNLKLDKDIKRQSMDFTNIDYKMFRINVDSLTWFIFINICKNMNISANYVLNSFIKKYNDDGSLVEVNIWV